MSELSLLIAGGRRRGRPRLSLACPSTDVCLKMPEDTYDRAFQAASRERITVPEFIRRAVDRALTTDFSNPK